MDPCEQQSDESYADDVENELDSQLIAGWSSTKRKVESVAEKVTWCSTGVIEATDQDDTDLMENLTNLKQQQQQQLQQSVLTEAAACSSTKKWSSSQEITESITDNVIDDGEDGSLIVVRNRSARRMETHSESIVTRKIRSQMIEVLDEDDEDGNGENDSDQGLFEDEHLIKIMSSSSIDDSKESDDLTSTQSTQSTNQPETKPIIASASVFSSLKSQSTAKLIQSSWSSSEARESIESTESYIEETDCEQLAETVSTDLGVDGEKDSENITCTVAAVNNQQVWSRIETIRDEYDSSSSKLSQSQQIWSSIHSESVESSEIISSSLINEKLVNEDDDKQINIDNDNDDGDDVYHSNSSSRGMSRFNSSEDNGDDDGDDDEPEKEIAVSIRRPSQSLVSAEAYVFRQRKSLEELETEIVIRKKRKPRMSKEMDETATIFIAGSESIGKRPVSPSPSPSSSSSSSYQSSSCSIKSPSLPSLSSLSSSLIPAIVECRRESLMETLTKHGSLDTETESIDEDDEEETNDDELNETNRYPATISNHIDKMTHLINESNHDFDWNINRLTSTVFKSDQEINDLF